MPSPRDRMEWPNSAMFAVALVALAGSVGWLLLLSGVDLWGSYDTERVGSVADWAVAVVTFLAVVFAGVAIRSEIRRWHADRDREREVAARQVICEASIRRTDEETFWDGEHLDRIRITVSNYSSEPIYLREITFTWPPGHVPLSEKELLRIRKSRTKWLGGVAKSVNREGATDRFVVNRWVHPKSGRTISIEHWRVGKMRECEGTHGFCATWEDPWRNQWASKGGPAFLVER